MPRPRGDRLLAAELEILPQESAASPDPRRRLLVPHDCGLGDLHAILQIALGGHDAGPHEFRQGVRRWALPQGEEASATSKPQERTEDERTARLCELIPTPGSTLDYRDGEAEDGRFTLRLVGLRLLPRRQCLRLLDAQGGYGRVKEADGAGETKDAEGAEEREDAALAGAASPGTESRPEVPGETEAHLDLLDTFTLAERIRRFGQVWLRG